MNEHKYKLSVNPLPPTVKLRKLNTH